MTARFDLVTMDSPDTDALAAFWSAALDLHEVEREDGNRWIVLADGAGIRRIGLQRGENRRGSLHLDLVCRRDEFEAEVRRLVELGAVVRTDPRHEEYGAIVNLADPDGNAFDVCAYH